MRFRDWDTSAAAQGITQTVPTVVTQCPFCQSQRVTTTGNAGLSSTYWRCEACGEIWNPTRQASGSRQRRW